jgi:colanic acid/amylovoran biosynthesis glycosyltransferase
VTKSELQVNRKSDQQRGDERLKVGLLVHDFPLLTETFVINQARGLVARGQDLTVLSAYGRGQSRREPMHDGVEAERLLDRAAYVPFGGSFLRKLEAKEGPEPLWRAGAFLNETALFAGRKFDIIHCQFGSLGLLALNHMKRRTLRTRKLVVHLRGYDMSAFVRVRGEDVYHPLWQEADLFMCNCAFFRDKAIAFGCPPEKAIIVGSSIQTSEFPLKSQYRQEAGPLKLVTVGRLTGKKGLPDVLEALALAKHRGQLVRLSIVGDGPLKDALETKVKNLLLTQDVVFEGALPHRAIAEVLTKSDCLIAASVTGPDGDQDAPVNSLKEAMVVGLPVIATRHGGIPELVIDGENGLLVPEHDPEAIANAFRRMEEIRDQWPVMGARGRARTIELYDHELVSDRILEAYRAILKTEGDDP